jgi:DNA polymerase-3 subunit gamma/tau
VSSTAPHQALYRRWRAQTFSQIVGQAAVVETLRNAVRANRVSHAILFVGPRGTGKTSLARILAKALNCTNLQDGDPCDACPSCVAIREGRALDLVEIDAASNRGIDAIRDLRERINYAPTDLRRKVYILDEAHQITKDAWNALLKSLEEPPDFVAFMFASTHPQDFPPAILSRLQRYDVRRLTVAEIEGKLGRILEAESIGADPGATRLIAQLAAGGMRDAESMLDQVLATADGTIDEARVRDLLGLAEADVVGALLEALLAGDAVAGVAILDALEDRGRDVIVVLDQVVDTIRAELGSGGGAPGDARRAALTRVARRLAAIDPERRGVGGIRLQLELALLEGPGAVAMAAGIAPQAADRSAVGSPTPAPEPRPVAPERHRARGRATQPAPTTSSSASAEPSAPTAPTVVGAPGAAAPPPSAPAGPPAAAAAASPSPAAEPSAAATRAAGTSDGIEQLREQWPAIVAHLSQSPPTKPLIAACRPVSVDGNIVTLGFPEDQAFLKDALERRRPALEEGIGRFLGHAVNVRCVATNLEHVPAVPVDPAAADLLDEARRIFADDLVDVGEVS